MSLSTLPGRGQEEIFLQILHMSTQELSDNLRENGLSEEGDKATKQARLLAAVLAQDKTDMGMPLPPENLAGRVESIENTLQQVLDQLKSTVSLVANLATPEQRRWAHVPLVYRIVGVSVYITLLFPTPSRCQGFGAVCYSGTAS